MRELKELCCVSPGCPDHESLRVRLKAGHHEHNSPAMTAGLADHIWSVAEIVGYQLLGTS